MLLSLFVMAGCAHQPLSVERQPMPRSIPRQSVSTPQGSYYRVQPGETLWGIAHDFGWDANSLARLNRVSDPAHVKVGSMLLIPPPPESNRFVWPARSAQPSSTGSGTGDRGLEIKAPEGSLVRASRTGRVAVATQQLAGFGKTVVLDHGDGYVTLYARLDQLLVSPGARVRQGDPIGRLGEAPLYFEIRYGVHAHNPLPLLP